MGFGKWIFVGTLCTFLADQVDRAVIGKVASFQTLGVYQVAVQLALLPTLLVYALVPQIVFPYYSRLHQAGRDLRGVFSRLHPWVAGGAAFLVSGLIGTGPALVHCLYDQRYENAGWMLQILALGAWWRMLEAAEGSVLWAMGRARASALSNAAKVLALLVLGPLGFWLGGFAGMVVGFAAADLTRYASTGWAVRRQGFPVLAVDLPITVGILVVSGTALLVGRLPGLAGRRFECLAAEAGVVILAWSGMLLAAWLWGRVPRRLRGQEGEACFPGPGQLLRLGRGSEIPA
jgi:O-antigen/teichoic acid export membrane protein